MDCPLPRDCRVDAGPVQGSAWRGARRPTGRTARTRRVVRRHDARPRRTDSARHHTLAVAQLLRLLPHQQLAYLDPRRNAVGRPWGSRHAVGDEPRLHRTRNPHDGLVGDAARPALEIPVQRNGRRRYSRFGVKRHIVRPAGGARTDHKRRQQCHGRQRQARRLHLEPSPLVDRKGMHDRGHRSRPIAQGASGRRLCASTRRTGRHDRRRSCRRLHTLLRLRRRRLDLLDGGRSGRRDGNSVSATRDLAACRRSDGRHCRSVP